MTPDERKKMLKEQEAKREKEQTKNAVTNVERIKATMRQEDFMKSAKAEEKRSAILKKYKIARP